MAVLIPRIRSINVRLSEDEYLALERFCVASSARSMSDFVRMAVQNLMTGTNQESALALSVNENLALVKDLEQKVKELATELAMLKAKTNPPDIDEANDGDATGGRSDLLED